MKSRSVIISCILIILPVGVLAHTDGRKDKERSQKVERSVNADSSAVISLCTMSGNIIIHGWDKNEVLARSSEAAQIELRRSDETASTRAKRVEVFVIDKDDVGRERESCQGASDVELNVPRGASVHVQTRDGDVSIAEVARAYAGTQNGDISIERVSRAIEICSIGGSIAIKDSSGRINISSVGGTVEVNGARPWETADTFEVTTVSGDIELGHVTHGQVNVRTVNGNMNLSGPLTHGGRYGFRTMSGNVTLALPADSSFQLNAKVSSNGEVITDFPLTLMTEASVVAPSAASTASASARPPRPTPGYEPANGVTAATEKSIPPEKKVIKVKPVVVIAPYTLRRVNATHGTGDAIITVASFSGTLQLKKTD